MAKGAFIGVGGVAKKIKNIYIGVGGVAKKVTKAYIGVNGVAKLFWSGAITSSVSYTGELSSTVTRSSYSGYGNNFGAVFKDEINSNSNIVYINASLTKTVLAGSVTSAGIASANPSYLLVTGGVSYKTVYNYINAINSSGTITKSATLNQKRYQHCSGSFGNYAFVVGGYTSYNSSVTDSAEVIDTSLTVSTITALSQSRQRMACGKNTSYILFAGGRNSAGSSSNINYNKVDAYDASLTHTVASSISATSCLHAGGWNDNYALFAGGSLGSTVDAYNTSLTKSNPSTLTLRNTYNRFNLMGCGSSGMIIFTGGKYEVSSYSGYIYSLTDFYNIDLTKTTGDGAMLAQAGIANINDKYFVVVGGIDGMYNDEDSEGYEYSEKVYAYTLA